MTILPPVPARLRAWLRSSWPRLRGILARHDRRGATAAPADPAPTRAARRPKDAMTSTCFAKLSPWQMLTTGISSGCAAFGLGWMIWGQPLVHKLDQLSDLQRDVATLKADGTGWARENVQRVESDLRVLRADEVKIDERVSRLESHAEKR